LVVSGIFEPAGTPAQDNWLSLMSQEYVDSYASDWAADLSLIVIPKAGQRAALDEWLEHELDSERITVRTYGELRAWFDDIIGTVLLSFSLMESIIAILAALALAGLNYVFVTQRQREMGVLNALGLNRPALVWRVIRETLFTTGTAWIVGLVACAAILLILQRFIYAPIGLGLDFFNITPWLYTLPVPIAVLAASAGSISWALSRLDPVAIIERR
jgi:ABC-type lipoprotein release transport system permease subunit